jgi:hypothetical protein
MADEQGNYLIATLLAECLDPLDQRLSEVA